MTDYLTLLDVFREQVQNPETRDRHAVECGDEQWTYDDLDVISTGLAFEIEGRYGARPTVAIICENLPYTFALHVAVWKLGGALAPIDYHTPEALLRPMLMKIAPTCVVISSTDKAIQKIVFDLALPVLSFPPEDTTMSALYQHFLDAPDLPLDQYPPPNPFSISIYLFTSSASDLTNIKCVPLTHQTIIARARSMLAWHRKTFPDASLEHVRLLGWGPFSHMMSVSDLACFVYLTAGCYIFGLTPSSYFAPEDKSDGTREVAITLLEAMEKYRAEAFTGVPWIFDRMMKSVASEVDLTRREQMCNALRSLKVLMLGGARTSEECIRWAQVQRIPLVLAIGMTELGGALFNRVADVIDKGWAIEDALISDAHFTLMDDAGNSHDSEGELCITSKLISKGYLDHDNSGFSVAADGITVKFKTGDRYTKVDGCLRWLGRKDDFVVLVSGEMVDPRVLEKSLDEWPSISRSCVFGNNFLRGSAAFLCALVELRPGVGQGDPSTNVDVARAIRSINRALAPPLRISWSHVFILHEGQSIPINGKGYIWRKKLEALYGNRVASLSSLTALSRASDVVAHSPPAVLPQRNDRAVRDVILDVVADGLHLSSETLELNAESTFAELGMDSAAALVIVGRLNERLGLNLPRNACHTHVDLNALSAAILEHLRLVETTPVQPIPKIEDTGSINDVVIVGQAVRLPGDLNTPEAFWEALVDMREDLLVPIPTDRWDNASFYRKPGEASEPCDISFERAGFVDIASFDNIFFEISSAEALSVGPNVRLVLETTFQALENANVPSTRLKGTSTGVFVAGGMDYGYGHLMFASMGFNSYTRFHGTGIANSTTCGRLSYLLDVHGPSVSIDTACSGGMVAFDQAVQYLKSGRAETAIVCGVNTHTWPGDFGFLSAQKMCSPNSRCATFASDADGYVPAEGVISLILKTRNAAERDGDTILAVIKATDTKHNGKSQGLVAPSAAGQAALQRSLIAAANLSPSDIDFVETHGTGTSLGDLIEIEGINSVFGTSHTSERPLLLGAAKTCVGHTEVVAGLVGIVKTIKQLSTGKVTGLNSVAGGKLNPELDTDLVPLRIPSHLTELPKRDGPYRALVVAYGFAGTLAGTILEAPPPPRRVPGSTVSSWMIFAISAKSRDALQDNLHQYLDMASHAPASDFQSICYTSCVGRDLHRYRFACVVRDLDGLVQRLKDQLSRVNSTASQLPNRRIVFAFPGQGSQFYGMANALATRFQDFRLILTDAANMATSLADFDVLLLLLGNGQPTVDIDKSAVAQICIFVYQYSVCRFLRKLGVKPDAVIGNSLGEISAAVEAGALSYELGLKFVVARAKILSPDPDHPAGMAAIAAEEATILQHINDLHIVNRVVIAVFSGPTNHVVSGDLEAIQLLVSHVKKTGIRATLVDVDQGFHSHCVEGVIPELEAWVCNHSQSFRPLQLPIFSTSLGKQVVAHESLHPHYWVDHARNPVQFQTAVAAIKDAKFFKNASILDVGPTPTARTAFQSNDISDLFLLASSTKKGNDQELAFLTAIASLTENGVNPNFVELFGTGIPTTNLPTYPFQRQRHYPDFVPSRSVFSSSIPGVATPSTPPLVVDETLFQVLNDHRIQGEVVLPASAMVDVFSRAKPQHSLDIRFHRPLVLQSAGRVCSIELNASGAFAMYDGDKGEKICSGTSGQMRPMTSTPLLSGSPSGPPMTVVLDEAVYFPFTNIQFGPLFRNIVSIRSWDDYAEGVVVVTPSSNPEHDKIRALDACLHMFGTFRFHESLQSGAFLPMALEGYSVYSDTFPSSFLCRYRLPIALERNNRVASTAFECISRSGELLASCGKYSVAWVDMGIPPSLFSFEYVWIQKDLKATPAAPTSPKLMVFGRARGRDWISVLSETAAEAVFVDLDFKDHFVPSSSYVPEAIDIGLNSTIILDATEVDDTPESPTFSAFWQQVLWLMKALVRQKGPFTFVVISTVQSISQPTATLPVLGAMVQGMLRVFRRETGLQNVYGIEFPGDVSRKVIAQLLKEELSALRGAIKDNIVSYRHSPSPDVPLVRVVPELRPLVVDQHPRLSGVAVIVGMGSIGFSLGPHMIAAGFSSVVFIGRRPETDRKVAQQLASSSGQFSYMQADASDRDALRCVLQHIQVTYGAIKSILHTAASVDDATIDSVTVDAFDLVLRPKVHGAYNLHLVAGELDLELESFVLFSSISVPLGNPGQVAYVAANTFLDALAALRRDMGLPGVSIQLGPWESELVNKLSAQSSANDGLLRTMTHVDGLPLIIRALASPVSVQVLAALDNNILSRTPAFATDSLFAGLVTGVGASKSPMLVLGSAAVADSIVSILRGVLEVTESEPLELSDSLTACGIDSIAFGQIRAAVLKELGVAVPMVYLSDAFSVNDMIRNVQESVLKACT
ncbi:hypothetical protein DFH07DRAFT_1059948 [Mycena maculata]|uniref:Polyketide synthase n=1 Tax=Mycena maculata TaxID=230809 RepID=A0AAD7JCB4_9AGAR|nr:hypothetical protein DFH07DRAFT_1059948 [Mycena maculata]